MISWASWSVDAFARARQEHKPVLLSIAARWCSCCREMDRASYADPQVARLVNERFVAIRVDADRRPDLDARYNLGGLPTTAFLTPEGAIAGGGTFVPPERLLRALERVLDAFSTRRDQLLGPRDEPEPSPPRPPSTRATPDALAASTFATYDAVHGGFGTAPKFPLTAPLHLALRVYATTSDAAMRAMAEGTLDAMATRGLRDDVDGGFFRCAATRDWQEPSHEKLLDINAALVRVMLDGADRLGNAHYRAAAVDALAYAQATLANSDGGWAGSQQADEAYYSVRTRAARAARQAPAVDRTLFVDRNAAMISAALHAADVLQDAALGEFAIRSLERVLTTCYQPGAGVAHYFDGRPHVRGLLDDQIAMAAAALDAAEATGRVPYEMMAQELGLYVLRTMWDDREGGLFDRAPVPDDEKVGLASERLKPFVSNCEAARLFTRLAASSGNNEFAEKARETIAALAPRAALEGPLAAHYLLAMREAGLR